MRVRTHDCSPDVVLHGGNILTMEQACPRATAVAVKDGRFVAVGEDAQILRLVSPATTVVDLQGRTVTPGIIDAHNHLLRTGRAIRGLRLYDCRSIDEIQERVAAYVKSAPPGTWVWGQGWNEMLLREQRFPTRWDLDAVAPDHPVVLQRTWNKLVVNSLALQICGIDRDIVWPPGDLLYAGEVLRNDSGELTGVFSDRAKDLVLRRLRLTSEQMQECIAVACRAYNSVGITSIVDPGLRPEEMRAYHAVRVRGDLTVRISMCVGAWGHTSVYAGEEAGLYERIHGIGVYTGFGDEWLRLDCVKIMPDGGGSDGTALMYEPFASNPESRGHATVPVEEIPNYVWFCHERGWSVDAHACGDRMLDIVVEAMATAYRRRPSTSVRHRVHHAYFAGPKALALMAEHRIAAITQPIFLWSQGENMIHHFGLERALRLMPARAFLEAGVPLAFSSDSPVADYNPWMGMYAALTRSSLNGFQFSRVDVVTREEALRAYTIDAAWMTFEEHLKGSIGPGKLADLVVLDRDYLTCPLEEVKDIRPVATMVGGRWVYGHM